MAGGTWNKQDKVRPGVYINFTSETQKGLSVGSRGVVAICEPMSWGPVGKVMEVTAGADTTSFCGYPAYMPQARFLQEIFKGSDRTKSPTKVLLYRPSASSAVQATVTEGQMTATALYPGVRGNDITIVVTEQADAEGTFDVQTVLDGVVVDTQTAKKVEELKANAWVTFSGTGALTETAGAKLATGADGTVEAAAYTTFLQTIEAYDFDVLIYDGDDSTVQAAMVNFVERIANTQGRYTQLVAYGLKVPDSRFVINVCSDIKGISFADGTTLTGKQLCWWVGGAEAGANYNESLTYAKYLDAVSVTPAMTNDQIIAALQAGKFVVFAENGTVKVDSDINSLTTFTADISKSYQKNRVIRTLHTIANDLYAQFSKSFIGVVDNNATGRDLFKAVIVGYLLEMQANNAIQNFVPEDVDVLPGDEIDGVVINLRVQPVDAAEKLYITLTVA